MTDAPTLDDLLNHYQADDGQPFSSDPEQLVDRLTRKLAAKAPRVGDDVDFTPKTKKVPKPEKAPDLSSFGDPIAEPSNDDLSSFGEEVKAPAPKPGVLATIGEATNTFGKGLLRGAPESAGSILQGTAALTHTKPISAEGVGLIDELGNSSAMSASERAKLMGRALRSIGDRGAQMDFNSALQRIARGSDAAAEAQKLRDSFGIQNQKAAAPIEQDSLYKAGKATKDWIDKTVPMTDEEKSSIAGQVGSGISGMVPYLAAGIIAGPEVGLVLGAAGMGAQTAGSTFEQAKAKGATDEQAATAAGWGAAIGASLGVLPLGMVFKPVSSASDTWKSLLAAKLVQAGQSGVTFATVGEAQHYLLEQVAKEQYDPKAGYSPDAKRIISSFLTGGVLGTMHPLSPKPSDLSSPEAIADFLRRAARADGRRTPEEERGAETRSEIDEFLRERERREAATRPGLPGPESPTEPPAGVTGSPPETPPRPSGGEPASPESPPAAASTERTEIEGLKRYGWTDDEIAGMDPAQRRREFQEAMASGGSERPREPDEIISPAKPGEFDQKPWTAADGNPWGMSDADYAEWRKQPENADAVAKWERDNKIIDGGTAADKAMGDLTELFGTRDQPIKAVTAKDVLDAQPVEPKSAAQAEAENFKHAHLELDHLGLSGRHSISIETGVGQTRNGPPGADGKPEWTIPSMPVAYGRIKGTKGADGQPLDIFVGPVPNSQHVFVVDQHHNDGGFDEHKILAGFPGPDAALRAYGDSYADKGGNRIGHVTAMTPEQFKDWLTSDTTQPLKKPLSEQEIGDMFDEMVGANEAEPSRSESAGKGGEPSKPSANGELQDSGSPQVPQEPSDGGPSPVSAGAVKGADSEPKNGEIVAPSRLYAEPTEEFHQQIEAVLGADYYHVLPVDIHRAAEILAESPTIPPHLAFQYAVIENAAEQKFLNRNQLEQVYGEKVKSLLEPPGEGTSVGGEPAEQSGTKPKQEPASDAAEAGIVPGGGETGEHPPKPTKGKDGEQHDAAGVEPNAKRKASGKPARKGTSAAESADDARPLTPEEFSAKYGDGDYDPEHDDAPLGAWTDMEPIYEMAEKVRKGEGPTHELSQMPLNKLFPKPNVITRAAVKAKSELLTPEQAQAIIQSWKNHAARIGKEEDHSKEVIFSLFDRTGEWSKPYRDAGYKVIQYDIHNGDDLLKFFPTPDILAVEDAGLKVVGVITAPPCTSYAVSGTRWWADQHDKANVEMVEKKYGGWAPLYFDTPIDYANTLVAATQAFIEFAKPEKFHVLENPVGRIQRMNGLPQPTLIFDPNHYGNPYTKKTLLWGDFNPDLPTANVAPTEGSKIHKLRGDDPKEKLQRSETPDGFAYAFFMANNTSKLKFEEKPSQAASLVDAMVDRLKGDGFRNILDARRLGKDFGTQDIKAVEETVELAAVKAAREIIESEKEPYPALVKLYGKQPRLGTRTSTSVRDQAYSTPVPLGYLAQKLAGIDRQTTVYEPTAGNGALLTAADPKKAIVNEINPNRLDNLRAQGFPTRFSEDAAEFNQPRKVDAVIANPPFGPVRENDVSKVFDMSSIQPGYKTTEIDHAIALKALDAMKDDGRAVLILGGLNKQVTTREGRSDGYNGKAKREFYLTLYGNYKVTDHFTVAGELYERQGAGWPVDVIVINGRGKSSRALPAVDVPRIYDSWESLGGLLDGQDRGGNVAADERPDGGAAEGRSGLAADGGNDRNAARRGGSASRGGAKQPAGVREEPVSGKPETDGARGSGDQEQGGPVPDRQRDRSGDESVAERSPSGLAGDKTARLLEDHDFKQIDDAPGRVTYEHGDNANKEELAAVTRALKLDGWEATGLREFKRGNEIIEIEPGGADTSGFYLHRMAEPPGGGKLSADEIGDIFDDLVEGKPTSFDLDGAKAEIQAGDSDETVTVSLSRKGPWDFNDTWPAPDAAVLEALDKEGRNPLADGMDPENVVGMLDEGLHGLTSALAEANGANRRIEAIKSGAEKLKRGQKAEDVIKSLTNEAKRAGTEVADTRASYAEVFGDEAADAMLAEARSRLKQKPPQSEAERQRAERDAPMWAEVLAELPMSKDGRTREHEIAFDIITQMTGKKRPKFDDLTPEQKAELLNRVKKLRSTSDVAKSAVKNVASAADEALSGLTELFGGGKTVGSGLNFDEETYKKARPMFEAAAEKFSGFKHDIRELMKRMLDHLKEAYAWTTETIKNAKPYIVRFIQDVQDGAVNLNRAVPEPAKPATNKAVETAGQSTYEPQSKTASLDTLVPVNMKKSISDALDALEAKVGPIDDFVAKELGYDKADLEKYFGAEQVDALGLAIDNLNDGKGFIIGDQTGIGKGRVNAAIIKWAMRKERIPVFTTEKPGLYADMFRDMTDIGMDPPRILATNAALTMPLDDAGKHWIKTADSKKHNAQMVVLANPEEFRKHFDVVFTNYSQMQTLKGESTDRRRFMSAIIPSSTIIFDESHNAGGQDKDRKPKGIAADRSEFARDLVKRANGVFYSSATYAKRPDVMSLYSATDMAMAVDDINSLGEAISKGGIPMQQVVASMLAKSGQYIRRERSFSGINYNTPTVDVDHDTYDQISRALAAIQEFSAQVREVTREISKDLKASGETIGADNATSDAGASSTNFTSIMHNIINQMLLAMKVPEASRMAIRHIKAGEKPVLTVANTMESFLKDYADTLDIKPGDEIDADFADVLMKYLDRSRRITIRKPFMKAGEKAEKHVLTDVELGPHALGVFNDTKAMIAQMDLSHLPISPIDYLKGELQKAGYEVGEITGRGLTIDYTGDRPVLRVRPGAEITTKGRNEARRRFNLRPDKGGLHAIVINQAGSTGISMHAGEKFDDRSKRRMMVVQPEANIDTHMQLLGRVNRTGQVVLPEYDQLVASIPAEKRPAAVLAKKMASLNANTTASRTSAVTAKDVPDFMNQYGDMVAANYLSDNFDVNERLAWPVRPGEGKLKSDDAMRKLTGRIPLLPLAEQEALYEHLEEEYAALIKQIEASGASPLEAKTFDLKARTLETSEVQGPKNKSGSPFAAPVNVEKVSVMRQGKPFKPDELVERLADRLGIERPGDPVKWVEQFPREIAGKQALEIERTERTTALKAFNDYSLPVLRKIEDAKELEAERVKLNAIKDRWTSLHTLLPIGARVRLNMYDNSPVAVVLDIKQTGKAKNPLGLSSWKVNFAVADASRQMTLPFSRLYLQGTSDPESMLDVEVVHTNETPKDTLARFEMMQSGAREERYIATGNLLAAYDWLNMKGSIINYTDAQGSVRQGIMTPKEFNLGKHAIAKGRIVSDPVELKQFLDQNQTLWSKDRQVNISRADRWSDNYQIQADKKKATGGRYYLDKQLTDLAGDFASRGGMMSANLPGKNLPAAIKRLQEIGAQFTVAAAAPQATKVDSPEPPPDDEPPAGGGGATIASKAEAVPNRLTTQAERYIEQIEQHLRQIVERVAGPGVKVEFSRGLIDVGDRSPGYTADTGNQAAGTYSLGVDLIQLAIRPGQSDQMITAAFHEAYHHVEARLQTEQERKLMEAETPRLREWIKGKTKLRNEQVDGLAGYEVRAIAFQTYANERGSGKTQAGAGIHIMVRRWFDRLMEGLRSLANGLRGLGFKTYNDIFSEAYTGKFAKREPNEDVGLDPQSMAALSDLWRRSDAAVTGRLRDVMNATTAVDRFKEGVQNLNEGVRRLEDAVEARMDGELPDSKAFYQKKRLFPGKVAAEVQDFNKQHLDPLIDTLKDRGLTLDQVGDILYAQHAAERNAYIDTINPDAAGEGSGMSNEDAQAILDRFEARDLDEIAHRVDGIRDFITDTMVAAGLESRNTINAWRAQYEHYVPLGGFAEPREDAETFRESGKFNVRGREVRQAFGRGSKADNPLLNILDQAYRTIERAKKNEYLRSLKLALSGLDPDQLKGFVQFDRGKPRREIDPRTGLVRWVDDSSYRFSPKAVAYKVGGNTRYMVFEKQGIADMLRRMHPNALNGVGQSLLNIQNKLKAMWTHYSPEFLIRHFLFRYPIEGTMNAFEQGPSSVPRYMADAIPFLGRASKAIFASNKGMVHPDAETAQYQRYWTEMREAGGAMAFRQARDVDLLREHLQKKLAAISGKPLANIVDKHRAAIEAMDTVTNALDNSLRLAAYATARGQGKTPEQAAVIARDATVDFQMAGAWKNAIGLWFPFGNVAIQTGARMGSAVGRSKIMRRVFAGTVMAGFLSAMFNYLVGGDDKDHIPFFDKMPEWEKHLNFTILNPFHRDAKDRPVPIHIPLPYNWAFPFALGQTFGTMAFSKTKGEKRKMIGMSIKAGIEAFSPLAEEGNLAAALAPELTHPLIHAYTNQKWTGTPQHLDAKYQKGPRSESGFKSTGEGWKYSTRMLNTISGGDRHHAGYIDMFPEDLRELFDYYSGTGTQRKFATNVATTASNAAAGKPTDYSKLPLARVVMGTDYNASDRARRQENNRESKRPWEH